MVGALVPAGETTGMRGGGMTTLVVVGWALTDDIVTVGGDTEKDPMLSVGCAGSSGGVTCGDRRSSSLVSGDREGLVASRGGGGGGGGDFGDRSDSSSSSKLIMARLIHSLIRSACCTSSSSCSSVTSSSSSLDKTLILSVNDCFSCFI